MKYKVIIELISALMTLAFVNSNDNHQLLTPDWLTLSPTEVSLRMRVRGQPVRKNT